MLYKVVFVEDEIVTREGIRDHVDWQGNGFEFCGEASDGETALQLLQTTTPDLLITDIKMPFMDGLELCRLVRERTPSVKIVILSGHDEFEYAQEAIKLGVTEYLLKPVTAQDLHRVLQKIAALLDHARAEQENARRLQDQLAETQSVLRDRFLLRLVEGAVSPTEAIERGRQLGLNLVARYYRVLIVKAAPSDQSAQFNYDKCEEALNLVSGLVDEAPDVFPVRMDWEELLLLMQGESPEYLETQGTLLTARIHPEIERAGCRFLIGAGTPKNRIAYIYQSLAEAIVNLQDITLETGPDALIASGQVESLGVGSAALETYLGSGEREKDGAVPFPDRQAHNYYAGIIQQAREYIDRHYANPDLFLHEVAAHVNLSPSHFSAIFSRQTCQTFKDYLTGVRIKKAKELLCMTTLKAADIASQVGYSDPHYFSFVFKKNTGRSPTEYRLGNQLGPAGTIGL